MAGIRRPLANHDVVEGCFPRGHDIRTRRNPLRRWPDDNVQLCGQNHRCKGFQIYVLPNSTAQDVWIEYKGGCQLLPRSLCADPQNQPAGGVWYAFRATRRCPPLPAAFDANRVRSRLAIDSPAQAEPLVTHSGAYVGTASAALAATVLVLMLLGGVLKLVVALKRRRAAG